MSDREWRRMGLWPAYGFVLLGLADIMLALTRRSSRYFMLAIGLVFLVYGVRRAHKAARAKADARA